jgi:hypothetical protein
MPFRSQAQRRLFYARPELHKYIAEFERATPKGKLPQHVAKHKRRSRRDALLARMKRR